MKKLAIVATIGISVLLFLVSLLFPAFYTSDEGIPGWFALLMGWLDLLAISLISASAGLALALCALVMKQILISEGGNTTRILSMGAGFYLWLASFAVCIIGAIVIIVQEANAPKVTKV